MSELIRVPDIGGEGEVIEILVSPGQRIEAEQSLLTLESDKASMEIPAPRAGVVRSLKVRLGDKLREGDALLELDSDTDSTADATPSETAPAPAAAPPAEPAAAQAPPPPTEADGDQLLEIRVPDLGTPGKAKVIEILVSPGDQVSDDQSLITLESDKASMEIPSPHAGIVDSIAVSLDSELGQGDLILRLRSRAAAPMQKTTAEPSAAPAAIQSQPQPTTQAQPRPDTPSPAATTAPGRTPTRVHAGPAVRMLARELGVDLSQVEGSGPKQRILKEDLQAFVRRRLNAAPSAGSGNGIAPIPAVDFSRFGATEEVPMSRLMQLAANNLQRSWLNIPHVTQFDTVDISDVEDFRQAQQAAAQQAGAKLTLLPILFRACAHLLREMPDFNSSLAPSGQALIRKKYLHMGFAVDTPDGLLVPVIRDVEQKSLLQLAVEAGELAEKARNRKLAPDAMQGACFTITSLGHIGGTGFTPIINPPEVAILGVSRATLQPVWDGQAFQPRLMLPLSLSYDHRVINGAAAARFTKRLGEVLADIRTLLL